MLEKIRIENFQANEELEIKLDPHVTTIIGPSDVGKSAIIRALGWVATNHPTGYAFITYGKKKATVTLDVDGHVIVRERGKTPNTYTLDGEEFKAFGNGKVPDEIANLLNVSNVNFQGQFDTPFWFCETPGEVSRQLNQIVNLEIIDKTLGNLDSGLKESRTRVKVIEQQLHEAKEERAALKWTRSMHTDLEGGGKNGT